MRQDAATMEEADSMMAGDPAISSGVLATEYFNWYGSAALPEYPDDHNRIVKEKM